MNIKALFFALVSTLMGCSSITPAPSLNTGSPNHLMDAIRHHEIIDLTHTLDKDFPFIPVPGVTFPFAIEPIATIPSNGVAANAWKIHEHLGTQIDAPNHFAVGGKSLEAISASEQIVPIVVIDFSREGAANRDAKLSVEHIKSWEARYGRIIDGTIVALYTGWDAKIGDASYIGLDNQHVKHFPGFGVDAIEFLVKQRNVWGVAVDTLSFDPGNDNEYLSLLSARPRCVMLRVAPCALSRWCPKCQMMFCCYKGAGAAPTWNKSVVRRVALPISPERLRLRKISGQ
jgi:kynurenine formamidase